MIRILLSKLTHIRRLHLGLLLVLTVISSIAEVISLASVIPFLGVLTQPDAIFHHTYAQRIIEIIGYDEPKQLLLPLTIFFIIAALIAGFIRLTLLYFLTRVAFGIGTDLSVEAYHRTLHQKYDVHLKRNSSEIINIIINQSDIVVKSVITPALILISSLVIMASVIMALLFIDPWLTISSFLFFGFTYGVIIKISRNKLHQNSKVLAVNSNKMIKTLQEGIGGIREILLKNNQDFYSRIYKEADKPFRIAAGNNIFIANSPRPAVEAIGISFIAILAFVIVQKSEANIAILGALALGCQRLLPVLQQSYSSYSSIMGAKVPFFKLVELLNQDYEISKNKIPHISFENSIELRNVSFRYEDELPWVLKNINIKILKGSSVGIIGPTGCGKSTLIDIIMGLLTPTSGEILVDGTKLNFEGLPSWRKLMSHVPQTIFLTDASFCDNIALGEAGVPNKSLVQKAAVMACIHDKIREMPHGYDTVIGERGVSLSGGQRQRLGIARALYQNTPVLILDEATSALDNETEQLVMNAINQPSKQLTKIIIAHRITTLQKCDVIFELNRDRSILVRNFSDIK